MHVLQYCSIPVVILLRYLQYLYGIYCAIYAAVVTGTHQLHGLYETLRSAEGSGRFWISDQPSGCFRLGCRGSACDVTRSAERVRGEGFHALRHPSRPCILTTTLLLLVMFRARIVSTLRPLTSPLVLQAARHPQGVAFRSFSSSRPNVLAAVQKRATFPSGFFFKQSRTFLTDSAPVVARPTQQEAWKRYGITAVR